MELVPPDPPLADGTILLRPLDSGDVPALVRACQDPEIPRWTNVPSPYAEEDAHTFVDLADRGWQEGATATFVVTDVETGALRGVIDLRLTKWPVTEIGYWVSAPARGRGAAARAVHLLAAWAFAIGSVRVEIVTDVENLASQRVPAKAGFQREGVLRRRLVVKDRRSDCVMYSLLPSDLETRGRAEGLEFSVQGEAVAITHRGMKAAVLRGAAAQRFLDDVKAGDPQGVMARATGNFKRGNERKARSHPRNRADR